MDIIFRVYFRPGHMKGKIDSLYGNAMALESELHSVDLRYESISPKEDTIPFVQIICNDKEEQ